jgi:SAM-dependent methyltransferase
MTTCQCQGIKLQFNAREAAHKLADYHKHGPIPSTRLLIAALKDAGIQDRTLLDIGGGLGAIQLELLKAGARAAVSVEASPAYLDTARQEARRQGLSDRVEYHQGDFVELASDIPPADIVTLDRVICCYPDMPALVGRSAEHARQLYALVYPRDTAWVRLGLRLENLFQRLKRSPFRVFAYPTPAIEALLQARGWRRRQHRLTGPWQVAVYGR